TPAPIYALSLHDALPIYQRSAISVSIRFSICRSEGIPYRNPTRRYFTRTTGSMGGRPYFWLYKCRVSSYTKDRSSAAFIQPNIRSEEHTSELQSRFDLVC